ncbi:acetyl-CoA acetyltransferase [Ruegeria marisrubri]|uniref:Acetyl-CoA acetyltransferase n=1 Tax=Ruegeria marisrubri TaxID=1685379 RepID=A0A0X3TBK5_9RHOB|nr:thiolase family protein [Ruegeria marisrubri]KUJ73154.1 acetyl-CoA acetyltransferase [Ruegeria marisrubri]
MQAHVIAARRTIVASRGGALAGLELHELAAPVLLACLEDAGLGTDQVDEVIVSNAMGGGGNPARLAALQAGLPERVGGLSIDRQCCGGLDALMLARAMVLAGQAEVVLAGGVESYSRRPIRMRSFADGSEPQPYDQPPFAPWPDRDPDMAEAAEALAKQLDIGRGRQDEWAICSHQKALAARDELAREILPLQPDQGQCDPFTRRLGPRLCARAPVVCGSITTANMAVAADGAAFCLVVSERVRKELGRSGATILGGASRGGPPELPGIAPVAAIRETLDGLSLSPSDLAQAEIMEAFAVQAIACVEQAGLSEEIVNRRGGALARGHPIGASGTILAVRLFHDLMRTGGLGLAAIAAAGGLGTALVLEWNEA